MKNITRCYLTFGRINYNNSCVRTLRSYDVADIKDLVIGKNNRCRTAWGLPQGFKSAASRFTAFWHERRLCPIQRLRFDVLSTGCPSSRIMRRVCSVLTQFFWGRHQHKAVGATTSFFHYCFSKKKICSGGAVWPVNNLVSRLQIGPFSARLLVKPQIVRWFMSAQS